MIISHNCEQYDLSYNLQYYFFVFKHIMQPYSISIRGDTLT